MLGDGDLGRHWNKLKKDVVKYGSCVEQEFSFDDRIIKTTFNFVFVVLDQRGRTSTVFQVRFCTIDELWDIVVSLKKAFVSFTESESMTTESGFDCFACINANKKMELKGCVTIPPTHNSAKFSFNTRLVFCFAMVLFFVGMFPIPNKKVPSFPLRSNGILLSSFSVACSGKFRIVVLSPLEGQRTPSTIQLCVITTGVYFSQKPNLSRMSDDLIGRF